MRVFFDSSAFVKRYVHEAGTDSVLRWCDQATEIVLSGVALAEIISSFCRLRREDKVSAAQYRRLKSLLMTDVQDAVIVDLTPLVLAQAVLSLESNALRGMDALHIGSALALQSDVFVSADRRQLDDAARMGLRAESVVT